MHNTQQRQRIVFSLSKNQPTKEQNLEPRKSSLHADEVAILSRQNPQRGLQSLIIVMYYWVFRSPVNVILVSYLFPLHVQDGGS